MNSQTVFESIAWMLTRILKTLMAALAFAVALNLTGCASAPTGPTPEQLAAEAEKRREKKASEEKSFAEIAALRERMRDELKAEITPGLKADLDKACGYRELDVKMADDRVWSAQEAAYIEMYNAFRESLLTQCFKTGCYNIKMTPFDELRHSIRVQQPDLTEEQKAAILAGQGGK